MQLKALGNNLVIKRINDDEQTTKSGLILSAGSQNHIFSRGTIISLGDGKDLKELNLSVGEEILFQRYANDEFKEVYIINNKQVFAKYLNE